MQVNSSTMAKIYVDETIQEPLENFKTWGFKY